MKKKTLLLIAALTLILVIFSTRTHFSFYNSGSTICSYWVEDSSSETDDPAKAIQINLTKPDSHVKVSISTTQHDLSLKINGCKNLNIEMQKDINIGLSRFIPLYKRTKFTSHFSFSWTGRMANGNRTIDLRNKGSFNIDGRFKIMGICSAKTTKKLIEDKIMEEARRMIEKNIREEMEKYKTEI